MADDDTLNTTTTTGAGIIFDTYTDWWVFLTITVVCWSVVYGVVSKSMRERQLSMDKEKFVLRLVALVLPMLLTPRAMRPPSHDTPVTCTEEMTCRQALRRFEATIKAAKLSLSWAPFLGQQAGASPPRDLPVAFRCCRPTAATAESRGVEDLGRRYPR